VSLQISVAPFWQIWLVRKRLTLFFFMCIYALVWMKTAHRRNAADTEERTLPAYCSELPKWCYADLERHRGEELLNKVIIFVFFVYKKYYCRFIKLRLNHWWQMDYSDDAFHTFLDLDTVIYLAVYGTISSLPVFIQNILNCVPKTNEAFTGLERHGGKWIMTKFSFCGGVNL